MENVEYVLLDDSIPDLRLELDFENITTKEFYYIVVTIKHCPSLVNDDIVSISEEMVKRIKTDTLHNIDKNTVNLFKILYQSLQSILNTSDLIEEMKYFCPWLVCSPSISPVRPPTVMDVSNTRFNIIPKKIKKLKKNKNENKNIYI